MTAPDRKTGDGVADEVLRVDTSRPKAPRAHPGRRRGRILTEAGYDAAAWIVGLLAASRVTGDLRHHPHLYVAVRAALAVSLLSAASGLLAGLYRRRYQRGSFDEVVAVGLAAVGTAVSLALLGGFLMGSQHAALVTIAVQPASRYPRCSVRGTWCSRSGCVRGPPRQRR